MLVGPRTIPSTSPHDRHLPRKKLLDVNPFFQSRSRSLPFCHSRVCLPDSKTSPASSRLNWLARLGLVLVFLPRYVIKPIRISNLECFVRHGRHLISSRSSLLLWLAGSRTKGLTDGLTDRHTVMRFFFLLRWEHCANSAAIWSVYYIRR
ncbi:hypothetical protein Mapa_007677 [Marchantia paleacea]|nr:hypothetical protein Mapa_007677 [Marchantia paleacea]